MSTTKPPVLEELTADQLASVTGGRKWCRRNGRWYVCYGNRAN
jgi:bacteriocin-like protein